jgi:hypothetical protein
MRRTIDHGTYLAGLVLVHRRRVDSINMIIECLKSTPPGCSEELAKALTAVFVNLEGEDRGLESCLLELAATLIRADVESANRYVS